MMIDTAFILAAGRGSRLGDITNTLPKPLVSIAGSSIIERLLAQLAAAGVTNIIMNVSYLWEQIVERLKDGHTVGCSIDYSLEPERLETAGGIIAALERLPERFLVVNADVVTDYAFAQLKARPLSLETQGHLVFVPNPPRHPEGDYSLVNKSVLLPQANHSTVTYSGISILTQALFEGIPPGRRPLSQVFNAKVAQQRLTGELFNGMWHDVGSIEGLQQARKEVEKIKGTAE